MRYLLMVILTIFLSACGTKQEDAVTPKVPQLVPAPVYTDPLAAEVDAYKVQFIADYNSRYRVNYANVNPNGFKIQMSTYAGVVTAGSYNWVLLLNREDYLNKTTAQKKWLLYRDMAHLFLNFDYNTDTCSLLSNPYDFDSCAIGEVNQAMQFYWTLYEQGFAD